MNLPCLEELEPVLSLFEGTLLSKYLVGVLIKLYKGKQSNSDLIQLIVRVCCIYILPHFILKPKKSSKKKKRTYRTTSLGNDWHIPVPELSDRIWMYIIIVFYLL